MRTHFTQQADPETARGARVPLAAHGFPTSRLSTLRTPNGIAAFHQFWNFTGGESHGSALESLQSQVVVVVVFPSICGIYLHCFSNWRIDPFLLFIYLAFWDSCFLGSGISPTILYASFHFFFLYSFLLHLRQFLNLTF